MLEAVYPWIFANQISTPRFFTPTLCNDFPNGLPKNEASGSLIDKFPSLLFALQYTW